MILDMIRDKAVEQIEEALCELEHDVKFVNIEGNKWQAQISFDLDQANMSEAEKLMISELLKHL